jgi:hypothetical protein
MKVEYTIVILTPEPNKGDLQEDPELIEQLDALHQVFTDETKKAGFTPLESLYVVSC